MARRAVDTSADDVEIPDDAAQRVEGILAEQFGGVPPKPSKPEAPPATDDTEGDDEPDPQDTDDEPTPEDLLSEDDGDGESDDEGEGEDPEGGDPQPETFTVKVDGKDVEVTREELLKGYSFTAHNTRKAQKLAEQERALAEQEKSLVEVKGQYASLIKRLDEQLTALEPQEPDFDKAKAELSPEEYSALYTDWQRAKERRAALKRERDRVGAEEQSRVQEHYQVYAQEQKDLVLKLVPELSHKEKGPALVQKLFQYAEAQGVSREQMAQVVEARAIVQWIRAMKYDELEQRAKDLKRKRKPGKVPNAAPGQGNRTRRRETDAQKQARDKREQLRQTGDKHVAADIVGGILREQGIV
jgi:hypothetical protein